MLSVLVTCPGARLINEQHPILGAAPCDVPLTLFTIAHIDVNTLGDN